MGCGCSSSSRNKSDVIETPLVTNPNFKTKVTDRTLESQFLPHTRDYQAKLTESKHLRNESATNDSLRNSASKFELNLVRVEESKPTLSDAEENKKDSENLPLVNRENRRDEPVISILSMEINAYLERLYDSVI